MKDTSSRIQTVMLAACCGITASNIYLIQPIAVTVSHHFSVGDGAAALLASAMQVAYAAGIILFVPIIDAVDARRLLPPLFAASVVCLLVMATASSWAAFFIAACLLGLACPIPQIIMPAAVGLSGGNGTRLVGVLQAGLLFGILGARFYAGAVATAISVQAVFAISCVLTAASALVAVIVLQSHRVTNSDKLLSVPGIALLRGISAAFQSPRHVLWVCGSGLAVGISFGEFWNSLTFLADRWYHLNAAQIGLFGLVAGASGAFSPIAGRLAERWGMLRVQAVSCLLIIIGWIPLAVGQRTVWIAIFATIVIDVGVWSNQVVNQASIFSDSVVPRGLANTLYFSTRFLGISIGSTVGASLFLSGKWTIAVVFACAVTAIGFGLFRRSTSTLDGRVRVSSSSPMTPT